MRSEAAFTSALVFPEKFERKSMLHSMDFNCFTCFVYLESIEKFILLNNGGRLSGNLCSVYNVLGLNGSEGIN